MPEIPLPPYSTFEPTFTLEGSPGELASSAHRWQVFADAATGAASTLRGMDTSRFVGAGGDKYREKIDAKLPEHLDTTADAHGGVAKAVDTYGHELQSGQSRMAPLKVASPGAHTRVQNAVGWVNSAEVKAAEAATTEIAAASADTAASGAAVVTGGLMAGAAASAASAHATATANRVAADADLATARAELAAARTAWEGMLSQAEGIQSETQTAAEAAATVIDDQAGKRFEENPTGIAKMWGDVKNFFHDHAEGLNQIAEACLTVGGVLAMVPGLDVIGAGLLVVGGGISLGLYATGNKSTGDFAMDMAGAIPGVGLAGKGAKGLGMLSKGARGAEEAGTGARAASGESKLANQEARAAEGEGRATSEAESPAARTEKECTGVNDPVDMATGAQYDHWTDLTVGGRLPLVINRHLRSSFRDGIAFGPSWSSLLDMRVEVAVDGGVRLVEADGAIQRYEGLPEVEGQEILPRFGSKPLSFVDGTYRVRDVPAGVTYEFAVLGETSSVTASSVVTETSLAGVTGVPVTVRLTAVVHHTGHRIDLSYAPSTGHPETLAHSGGAVVEVTCDPPTGHVLELAVTDAETPRTTATRYEYSAAGDLIAVIDPEGQSFRYSYDDDHRVISWTSRAGETYRYVYDRSGRVVAQVGTRGMLPAAYVYLADTAPDAPEGGRVVAMIEAAGDLGPVGEGDTRIGERLARLDQLPVVAALLDDGLAAAGLAGGGRAGAADRQAMVPWAQDAPTEMLHDELLGEIGVWIYRSTASGDVWRIVSPEGVVTEFERDARHNLTAWIRGDGSKLAYGVDEYGCVTAVTDPYGRESRIEYAPLGVPVRQVDAAGRVTEVEIDALGDVTAVTEPDGARSEFTYDLRASGSVPTASIAPDGSVTQLECDDAGRVVRSIDPLNRAWSVRRNLFGDPVEVMDPEGHVTTTEWSVDGRVLERRHPDGTSEVFRYDADGGCVSRTDEAGNTRRIEYSVCGRVAAEIDPMGGRVEIDHDTRLRQRTVANPEGLAWVFEWNRDAAVIAETDYDGARTEFELDGLRRAKTTTDALGRQIRHRWDIAGRVVEEQSDDGATVYSYDADGLLVEAANPDAVVRLERDELGRVVAETINGARVESSFDVMGRRTARSVTVAEGGPVWESVFAYDAAGALTELATTTAGIEAGEGSRFAYDGCGRRVRRSIGSTAVLERTLDVRSRRISERISGAAGVVAGRQWSWRADGYVTAIDDHAAGRREYDLDACGRILAAHTSSGSERLSSPTTVGRSTAAQGRVAEAYAYDAAGTLTAVTAPVRDAAAGDGPRVAASPVTGTAGTQVQSARVGSSGTQVTQVGRTRYVYDAAGQLVEKATSRLSRPAAVWRFTHTARGQIRTVTTPDGSCWRYAYDAFGRRIGKTHTSGDGTVLDEVAFAWDGDHLAAQHTTTPDGGSESWCWVYDPAGGDPLEQHHTGDDSGPPSPDDKDPASWGQDRIDTEFHAIVADLAGTPTELINPHTGQIDGRATRTVWGHVTWTGAASSPLSFAGQQIDAETGLHYNRYRYYDPTTANYTTPDPLGLAPNPANNTTYVHNPHTWIDPLGLTCEPQNGETPWWDYAQRKGEAGNRQLFQEVRDEGWTNARREVSVRSQSGLEGRIDVAAHQDGQTLLSEAKNGPFAKPSTNQAALWKEISQSGFTPFGENATAAGFQTGDLHPPTDVILRNYNLPPIPRGQ